MGSGVGCLDPKTWAYDNERERERESERERERERDCTDTEFVDTGPVTRPYYRSTALQHAGQGALVTQIDACMEVCCITWSSDESMIVAAGWKDNRARAWHIPLGMPAQPLAPLRRMVSAVEWIVGHWLCAGGGGDEVILLWRIEPQARADVGDKNNVVARLATGGRTVISLSCSSDGKQLVALLSGQVLRVYDLDRITRALPHSFQEQQPLQCQADTYWNDALGSNQSADGHRFPPSTTLHEVCTASENSLVLSPEMQRDYIRNKTFEYLASGPYAHVQVFECFLEICEPVAGLSYITSVIAAVPLPHDCIMLNCVSLHGEPSVVEWDMGCNEVVQTFRGHNMKRFVTGMAVGGPGEALVCAGSEDGHVVLWQRQSGRQVKVLVGHTGAVNALSWCLRPGISSVSAHGECGNSGVASYLLASASDDCSVRIWSPLSPPDSANSRRQDKFDLRQVEPDDSGGVDACLTKLLANVVLPDKMATERR